MHCLLEVQVKAFFPLIYANTCTCVQVQVSLDKPVVFKREYRILANCANFSRFIRVIRRLV